MTFSKKAWIVPISGTIQMAHMVENTGAAQVHFTPDELSKFNTELTAIKIEGERLPQFVLAMSGVEAPEKK